MTNKKLDNIDTTFTPEDIAKYTAASEVKTASLILHELGAIQEGAKPIKRTHMDNIVEDLVINEKLIKNFPSLISKEEALKGPPGQGMTPAYKKAAKEIVELLDLKFVEPSSLREKFKTEKSDKNTPK